MATIISIVSYPFLPAKVGGQKGVALFNKYFSNYHQLICVTTKNNDPAAADYEVLNILSNSPARYINFFYFFLLRRIIKEKHATHIILEHPYYGWLGILLKWFCGVKLIVHSHNIEGLRWKTLHKWWWHMLWGYEKFTHRQADFNFFIHDEDKQYAIQYFGVQPSKCITMTYGIEWNSIPPPEAIKKARQQLLAQFNFDSQKKILLFNGAFNYSPNLDALRHIIEDIDPLLEQANNFNYIIIICGRDIPQTITDKAYKNIIIAGFVEDIGIYFKAADVFLNPITEGGGIKTKLVEALGYNLNAVSTRHGAIGIDPAYCNGKLLLSADNDWNDFAKQVIKATKIYSDISPAYFEHFYWGYSTRRAAEFIENKK
jgi:glycosyltransferase involved in cell wall biosynthesis